MTAVIAGAGQEHRCGFSSTGGSGTPTLELESLTTSLSSGGRLQAVVLGLDLRIDRGEIVGVVGESGSGKTVTVRSIVGALPSHAVLEGSIRVQGEELVARVAAASSRDSREAYWYDLSGPAGLY